MKVDFNLRGAYLHVLADALTSVLAIASLSAGKMLGWSWLDPVVGLLGAVLVSRWAWGLARDSAAILLDREAPAIVRAQIRTAMEKDGDTRVTDLHVWSVGRTATPPPCRLSPANPAPPRNTRR